MTNPDIAAAARAGLPPERSGMPAPPALAQIRAALAAAPTAQPAPGVAVGWATYNGVACLELSPPEARRTILYFHGGGYRLGRCEAWIGLAGTLARLTAARVVLPDYRLAPEYPYPAALHDAMAVFTALEAANLVIAGDSAGGGLAAATILAAARAGIAPPAAAFFISPWLDLGLSGESFALNSATDRFFPLASAREAAQQYLQGHPADDPLVSPLAADLKSFPASLVLAGGDETLLADATRFATKLAFAGVTTTAHFAAGMQHVWPLLYPDLPETKAAIAAIAGFVERSFG